MAILVLTHTDVNLGSPVFIQAESISMTIKKKNSNSANANYNASEPVVRVQSQSIENPLYTISGITLYDAGETVGAYTALTEELLKDFFVLPNDDSNPIIMYYIDNRSKAFYSLNKYSGSRTSDIPVTFEGQIKIDSSIKSTNAKQREVGSIILKETLKV